MLQPKAIAFTALIVGLLPAIASAQTLATAPQATAPVAPIAGTAPASSRVGCHPLRQARERERSVADGESPAVRSLQCPDAGLLLAGYTVFSLTFAASFYTGLIAAVSGAPAQPGWLTIPLVGPFIAAAHQPRLQSPEAVLALTAGVLEWAGLGMGIAGLFLTRPWASPLAAAQAPRTRSPSWTVAVTPTTRGLAVSVMHF